MGRKKEVSLALSGRERQIAELAATGLTDKAVAEQLGLSPHTIGQHWRNIREKLEVASRTEAVAVLQGALGKRLRLELDAVEARVALAIESHRRALALCHSQQDRLMELVAMLRGERLPPEGFIFFDDEATFEQAYPTSHCVDLTPSSVAGGGMARPYGLDIPPIRIKAGGRDPYRIVVLDWDAAYDDLPRPAIQFDRPDGREGAEGCLMVEFEGEVHGFGARLASRTRWAQAQDAWRIEVQSESRKALEYALTPCSGSKFFGVRCTEPLRRVCLRPSEACYGMIGAIRWAGPR